MNFRPSSSVGLKRTSNKGKAVHRMKNSKNRILEWCQRLAAEIVETYSSGSEIVKASSSSRV